ncbi:hypothetical protein PAXRUDRAFT_829004 [Paxillus rubicundulus Ve08.2h10]|uniref:Uncharacterized protein n=1 Tax=Paxillus rubicundulus Ve08.2h10 TaxID=930991 RepID=A0A0D0E6S1_9AGAM|nr:hypothetical protein PAXRUDRAFT_829004 [Paxillus rubicundulus Ve08.2h10]
MKQGRLRIVNGPHVKVNTALVVADRLDWRTAKEKRHTLTRIGLVCAGAIRCGRMREVWYYWNVSTDL